MTVSIISNLLTNWYVNMTVQWVEFKFQYFATDLSYPIQDMTLDTKICIIKHILIITPWKVDKHDPLDICIN